MKVVCSQQTALATQRLKESAQQQQLAARATSTNTRRSRPLFCNEYRRVPEFDEGGMKPR